ncbi:MAG: competence/damage-inducible protein A [Ignavibacteria bacterium]|nr:competence/damage-inducible protein A [Ignavibacteria bacterium]
MNIGIITVGDELLVGQVINTNAAFMAEQCTIAGHNVRWQVSVADNIPEIHQAINWLKLNCDAIVTSGGLGPTHDDVTSKALADYFGDELVTSQVWLERLKKLMSARNSILSATNATQAVVPASALLLENSVGAAPGLFFNRDGLQVFCLPGVPFEMRKMLVSEVLPLISEDDKNTARPFYRTFHTAGIVESNLSDMIGDISQNLPGAGLAILPSYRGVRLRIGVTASNKTRAIAQLDELQTFLHEKIGRYFIGTDSIIPTIAELLVKEKRTVSVAESCTGGMLGAAFTEVPGSSVWFLGGVVTYTNDLKEKLLQVNSSTLATFGAVSRETAIEMATGAKQKLASDFAIAITGIAGPDGGTADKPVGTVWISVSGPKGTVATKYQFGSDRQANRERSVGYALWMLLQYVRDDEGLLSQLEASN